MSDQNDIPGGGMLTRLKAGLARTRELLLMNVGAVAPGIGPVYGNVLDQLEEALILADVGAELSREYVDALRAAWRRGELPDTDALRARLRGMVADTLAPRMVPLKVVPPYPFVVLVVTAGRLHTKSHLMEEVRKVVRVIGKEIPGAPHEVLLVLDATNGRNAIAQAKTFQ